MKLPANCEHKVNLPAALDVTHFPMPQSGLAKCIACCAIRVGHVEDEYIDRRSSWPPVHFQPA